VTVLRPSIFSKFFSKAICGILLLLTLTLQSCSKTQKPALEKSPAAQTKVPILPDNFWHTYETENLDNAQKRGRAIWFQATMGNGKYHTEILQQGLAVLVDWGKVLNTELRDTRFRTWGVINDPDCIKGNDYSFGFDICPGDDKLLESLHENKPYIDPATDLEVRFPDAFPFKREKSALLEFGTSAGAVGFRKIRNPKFDLEKWKAYNKQSLRYVNYTDSRVADGSVQPPFYIGVACAACHTGLYPINPPMDPEHPSWDNISGYVGGQHLRFSEILASGMDISSLPYQAFVHARAGTTDTSQLPTDKVFNPGSINPIFNVMKRERNFTPHTVTRYFRNADGTFPEKPETRKNFVVPNVLKGGEDTVGEDLALQRVFVNIGMCAEECWINHLIDFKALAGRNIAQSPFDIGQCRRDCGYWRAIEDRITDLQAFLNTRQDMPLEKAGDWVVKNGKPEFDRHYGETQVAAIMSNTEQFKKGKEYFARKCASCHSNQLPPPGVPPDDEFLASLDFHKRDAKGIREDWLGNDKPTPATVVNSNICRALHSNHMKGHIWEHFAADDLDDETNPDRKTVILGNITAGQGHGRGYYRNISLLSVWMSLQLMNNKGLGQELCSYTPMAIKARGNVEKPKAPCVDPEDAYKVSDRLKIIDHALDRLLLIEGRDNKTTVTDAEIKIKLGNSMAPQLFGFAESGADFIKKLQIDLTDQHIIHDVLSAQITIPPGVPVVLLGSLDEQAFLRGQVSGISEGKTLTERYRILGQRLEKITQNLETFKGELRKYANCSDEDNFEDQGHEPFVPPDLETKLALKAFLKTL
jgi:mono/diheme cytochrome c family protein